MSDSAENDDGTAIEDDLSDLIGMRCRAPYTGSQMPLGLKHAAIVLGVDAPDAERGAMLSVLYTHPLVTAMRLCPRFVADECRYTSKCKYSHGTSVPASEIADYDEPDFESLEEGSPVLVAVDPLWEVGRVTAKDGARLTVKILRTGAEVKSRIAAVVPIEGEIVVEEKETTDAGSSSTAGGGGDADIAELKQDSPGRVSKDKKTAEATKLNPKWMINGRVKYPENRTQEHHLDAMMQCCTILKIEITREKMASMTTYFWDKLINGQPQKIKDTDEFAILDRAAYFYHREMYKQMALDRPEKKKRDREAAAKRAKAEEELDDGQDGGTGFKLTTMMGYKKGEGLGKRSDGIVHAIQAIIGPKGASLDAIMQKAEGKGKRMRVVDGKSLQRLKEAKPKNAAEQGIFSFLNRKFVPEQQSADIDGKMQELRSKEQKLMDGIKRNAHSRITITQLGKQLAAVRRDMSSLEGKKGRIAREMASRAAKKKKDII